MIGFDDVDWDLDADFDILSVTEQPPSGRA